MKKILIPTDFSSVADNATKYAIELAEGFKSKLYLYHVYSINKVDYDLNIPDKDQPFRKKVKLEMEKTLRKFSKLISQKGLTIKEKVYQGEIFSLFGRTVKKDGIDLVVMGSKGATGLAKIVFGSVAATALEMSKIPLLVIPPDYEFKSLQNIVFAKDNKKVLPDILLPLQNLADKFGSKVTVLNINSESNLDNETENFFSLNDIETYYKEIPISKNVNESINKYVSTEDCDLLCMVRRKKSFFSSFFKTSVTKNQIYNSKVPVLVLPEN